MDDERFRRLVRRVRTGDESAREEFYALALRLALPAARKRVTAADRAFLDSQDVRQSALLRLHARLPELYFEQEGDLAAWLAEVTVRLLREKRRNAHRQRRDVGRNVGWPTGGLPDRLVPSVRKTLTRLAVEDALKGLPRETADVVRLRAFEGRSFADVAATLGLLSAEAARKRFARALAELSRRLGTALDS